MEFEPTASWLRGMHSTAVLQPQVHDFRKSRVKKNSLQSVESIFVQNMTNRVTALLLSFSRRRMNLIGKEERKRKRIQNFFQSGGLSFNIWEVRLKKNFEGWSKNYSEGNRWGKKWLTNWLWSSSWLAVGGFDSSWHLDKRPSRSWKIRRKTAVYGRALSSGECGDYNKW